jgi:hypothetical protein
VKFSKVANKAEVFNKIKEIHHRMGTATPQILVSLLSRELAMDLTEANRHLEVLQRMDLIKLKGTGKGAIELTRSGLSTTLRMAAPSEESGTPPSV